MHVLTQLSVPSNFEKPKRTVRLLGRIGYVPFNIICHTKTMDDNERLCAMQPLTVMR